MTEKRFTTNGYYINDTYHDGTKWLVNEVEAEEIVDMMNRLDMKARERSKALSKLQKRVELLEDDLLAMNWTNGNLEKVLKVAKDENEQLKRTIEKQDEIIKGQDAEISRQYKLCLTMSGVLREEFGVYDVFDRTKDKKV